MRAVGVGICGGSASGKSTLAQALLQELRDCRVSVVQQDSFYRDQSHVPLGERDCINFDHPDSIEFDLLRAALQLLIAGSAAEIPRYDFLTHTRLAHTQTVPLSEVIIVEGTLIFADPGLCESFDVRVYVHADDDVRLIRRLQRDTRERGRTFDSVIQQYLRTVRPMHREFVEPSKIRAELIVDGDGDIQPAVQTIAHRIRSLL